MFLSLVILIFIGILKDQWPTMIKSHQLTIIIFFSLSLLCRYNKLSRTIRDLAKRISEIDAKEPFRNEMSALLLEKLYVLGLIPTKWDLNNATNISASSFCRRRLPIVMVRSKCQTIITE